MSRSRWLVGSSRSSRFGCCHTISASASRAFSPPEKPSTGGRRHVAGEIEAAEVVAQGLLARARVDARRCAQRRLVGSQDLERVLREVADAQVPAFAPLAGQRRQPSREQLHQRRLAGAVATEEADARARPEW